MHAMTLSEQQNEIVELPLVSLSITACAGSGKTRTAVHRLAKMRSMLDDDHGMVALLSFSNVAVETFKKDYLALGVVSQQSRRSMLIEIDTVDGFITNNILRPHAFRTMKCGRTPFLVDGREPFLKSFTVFDGNRPHPTSDLQIRFRDGKLEFGLGRQFAIVDSHTAKAAISKLGKVGAYTHTTARYWAIRALLDQPTLTRALVRRFPHILIDEAQDIGPLHEAILQILVKHGATLTLIGDVNQGIYEFSDADGRFLKEYGSKEGVTSRELERNYRSVPEILRVANKLCGRKDDPDRAPPETLNGAFYFSYKPKDKAGALAVFRNLLDTANIAPHRGVVLCRSSAWAEDWSGAGKAQGQGCVKAFVEAVILRDRHQRMDLAFASACAGIVGLLDPQHREFKASLTRGAASGDVTLLRREIWSFVRNSETGLPSGNLQANTEWHTLLVKRVKALLDRLAVTHGITIAPNVGMRLAKTGLDAQPLIEAPGLADPVAHQFRVATVHRVKGESIDAVMYVTNKEHATALLNGTADELGRIGYVALTRARDLFVLAVPEAAVKELKPRLDELKFRLAGDV